MKSLSNSKKSKSILIHYPCGCIESKRGKYTGLKNQCCPLSWNLDTPDELKCDRLNKYKKEGRVKND